MKAFLSPRRLATLGLLLSTTACSHAAAPATLPDPAVDIKPAEGQTTAEVVLAGGCFWCTEAVLERVPGVTDVVPGYSGGTQEEANYDAVSTGNTGHAEAIRVKYDPTKVSYGKLLKVFFDAAHDPTQLNRQGPDVGKQYRSAIFYADEEQKRVAEAYIKQLNDAKALGRDPIVTTLEKLTAFYSAEKHHQDYAQKNPDDRYMSQNLPKKIEKLEKMQKTEGK